MVADLQMYLNFLICVKDVIRCVSRTSIRVFLTIYILT